MRLALFLGLLVLVAAIAARSGGYERAYRAAVRPQLAGGPERLVTEADLATLPEPVRVYLRRAGAVGRPRVRNFRVRFAGTFRNGLKAPWMDFRSEQYDFVDRPARMFLMRGSLRGVPARGLHLFQDGAASMRIQLASLFQVVDARGPELDQGETVTWFNDLCLFAPAALVDPRIQWEPEGPSAARARVRLGRVAIGALLRFGPDGDLVDFVSEDRFLSADGKSYRRYPWSTPAGDYRDIGGRRVPGYGEAVWHTPEGEFCYGRFHLADIEYNCGPESL